MAEQAGAGRRPYRRRQRQQEDSGAEEQESSNRNQDQNQSRRSKRPRNGLQIRLLLNNTTHSTQTTRSSTPSLQKEMVVPPLPSDMDPEPVCPICERLIIGDFDEINEHIDECIGGSVSASAEASSTMDSELETSSWTVARSAAASSLINVDDEEASYGRAQYNEMDVEAAISRKPKSAKDKEEAATEIKNTLLLRQILLTSPTLSTEFLQLQTALKLLLDRLAGVPKCAVCWGTLKMPAVASVNCWHVFCEECWLKTLGTKRLCPQCSTITNPSDLRKVFF